jgi:hypothetical protein
MDPTMDPMMIAQYLQGGAAGVGGQPGAQAPGMGTGDPSQTTNPMLSMTPDQIAAISEMMQTSGQNGSQGDQGNMMQNTSLGALPPGQQGMLGQMPPGMNFANMGY